MVPGFALADRLADPRADRLADPLADPLLPAIRFDPALLLRAQGSGLAMKAVIFDVDGVLTDGRILIGADGESLKAFSTLDGHGLKLLLRAGIMPIIITGRDSPAVRRRVADLQLPHAAYGVQDKLAVAHGLLSGLGIGWGDVAAVGDDWPDLPLLARAALACAPANAHLEVKAIAHFVTAEAGGHGAARSVCDLLLVAAGRYAPLLHAHLQLDVQRSVQRDLRPDAAAAAAVPPAAHIGTLDGA